MMSIARRIAVRGSPETKCRCSTDLEPESSDDRADDPASVLPVAPTPIAVAPVVAPTAPVAPEAAPAPLIATDQDSCPKYIALSGSANVKSKFNQVDDGWCDKNCRGNYLSCPKDKCRCFNEDHPEGSLVGDDAMIASAHAADKAAINSTPGLATSEEEALGGNCPKFVSIGGTNNDNTDFVNFGGVSKVQGHQVDNEYCEKNCRAGFCPETKCRCTTDPDLQSSDEGAEDATALLPVAPTPIAVAPLVAPTAPVAPEEEEHSIEGNCPKFVSLGDDMGKSHFNKGVDNDYCERNCRAGFCPETKCRCSTDPETSDSDDEGAEDSASAPLAAHTAPNTAATPTDDCPSYVSNLPPAGDEKGPFKRVDDEYCETNCRKGFCPEASCRCSTEPAPERSDSEEDAAAEPDAPVKWWKNKQKATIAQPIPWWKTAKTGKSGHEDDFADDGADWEPKNAFGDQQEVNDDNWMTGQRCTRKALRTHR